MAAFIMNVVGLLLCAVASEGELVHLSWMHSSAYDDVLPEAVDMTSSIPATSLLECAGKCSWVQWCNTFFYNDVKGACLRQRMTYEVPTAVTSSEGWRYYKLTSGGADHFSDRVSGFHYRVDLQLEQTWTGCRERCQRQGEDLAVLEPTVKADFIHTYFSANAQGLNLTKDVFIGAKRPNASVPFPATGQDFYWVNGQHLNVTATSRFWWQTGQPVFHADKGALELTRVYNFTWKVGSHENGKRHALCEKPFSLVG